MKRKQPRRERAAFILKRSAEFRKDTTGMSRAQADSYAKTEYRRSASGRRKRA